MNMLSTILGLAAPMVLGPAGLGLTNAAMAGAIGSGVGSLLQGGSTEDALGAAALGGLGGYMGGQMGGAGGNMAGGSLPGYGFGSAPGMAGAGAGAGEALASGAGNIPIMSGAGYAPMAESGIMSQLTRPEAIGAGLGGLAADSMLSPAEQAEKEKREFPEGKIIKNTSMFPDSGYLGGANPEFNYNMATNYAEGGELEDQAAMDMGLGGMGETQEGKLNDKELISGAIDIIQGEIQNEDQQKIILGQFIAQFGQEALQDLVSKVQSGEISGMPKQADGMVEGAGDGMADMIPASLGQDQDVLLSDGEFVVPADVVSGIGNGSSDAGSSELYNMMDRVREMRTGGKTQPPAVPSSMMMPA